MESAEGGLSSFGESKLCEDVKTETWLTSDGGTSGSLELVTSGLLIKTVKEEEPDDIDYICGGPSSSLEHITPVDQQNGEILQKPVKEEEPDDVSLYCEECRTFFVNKCEVHGPALFISDTPVSMGVTDRARQTLPPGLEIGESGISDAGLGVFNKGETVPVGAHFGPYEGDLVDKEEAMNSGYSWVINKSGQFEEYVDAKRETHANWMRYVNCARNDKENNLVAFQYRGGIHYRRCRPIQSGQELLLWYEEEYAKNAGTTFNHLWNKKSSFNKMTSALSFSCSLCLFSFTTQIYLHKHIKNCHTEEYLRMLKSGEIKYEDLMHPRRDSSRAAAEEEIYHCSKCGKNFSQHSYFKTHRCIQSVKLHHCSQCNKSFTKQAHLKLHQLVHIRENPLKNNITQQTCLQVHRRVHVGDKPYHCSECGKSFRIIEYLKRHQLIHTTEKPYHCSECGKSFGRLMFFQAHQRIHTGEKPHHCSDCGKSFLRKDRLKQHQRLHTGEKPYCCLDCGRSFLRMDRLKQHQRIHTGDKPHHCSDCGKSFLRMAHLKQHQRIHTGEKPFRCSQCGKSFTHRIQLHRHRRIHTGGKLFQCSECGKSFSEKRSFTRHQQIHG